jgi:hypothetical protein
MRSGLKVLKTGWNEAFIVAAHSREFLGYAFIER